jgi:hypothetical protein
MMKRLIIKILLFCLPVALFIAYVEHQTRTWPSMYEAKKRQLLASADSIQLLILGNSSAQDGIDPTAFTPYAFNLAFVAQPYYFDIRLTEKYLPQLPNLKYVVITSNLMSLCYEDSRQRGFFYQRYFGIKYKNETYRKENLLQTFFVYDSEQIRFMLRQTFRPKPEFVLHHGWNSFPSTDYSNVRSTDKARLRAEFFNRWVHDYKGGDAVFDDLEAFIVFLLQRDIEPVIVMMPNFVTMRQFVDPAIVSMNREKYDSLADKHGICYLDLYADESFTIDDFHNFDHLNVQGSRKLAEKIDSVIMNKNKQQ